MNWYWKTWGWAIVLAPVAYVLDIAGLGFWAACFLTAGLFILGKRLALVHRRQINK